MLSASSKNNNTDSGVRGKPSPTGVSFASSIQLENIGYHSDDKQILEDVSLSVEPQEVLCLLGPSGSGKTTLLRLAAGLIAPNAGSIKINEQIIADKQVFVPPDQRGVGLVFQDSALFPHLTILQNVEFGLTALGKQGAYDQAMRMLSRVGLEDRAGHYPHVLSGGEQQRVALARALAPRPGILLMDEPFSGLDSRLRDAVRDQALALLRETRSTTIMVTHDAEEALRVGDRIALLRDGKLVQYGTAEDLYNRPNSLFTARFFSEVNVISASVNGTKAKTVFGEVKTEFKDEKSVCAAIRLTDFTIKPYRKKGKGQLGRIAKRRFLGTSELMDVAIDGMDHALQIRIKTGELPEDTSLVLVSVELSKIMTFKSE